MNSSTHIARSDQARAQDTLRWGGVVPVNITQTGPSQANLDAALANAAGVSGKQLVNAHWRWPLTWSIALVLTAQNLTGDIFVTYEITMGSGDAQETIRRTINIANGQTDSTVDNVLRLPACDIMIRPTIISSTDSHAIAGPGSLEICAFAAPETEPHAMLAMLDCMCRLEEKNNDGQGVDQRQGDWMPPGFTPEPLRYRR
jgi:hypothetical protein